MKIGDFEKAFNKNSDELLLAIEDVFKNEEVIDVSPERYLFIQFDFVIKLLNYFYGKPFSLKEKKLITRIEDIFPGGYQFYTEIHSENDQTDIKQLYSWIIYPSWLEGLNKYDLRNKTSFAHLFKELHYKFACLILDNLETKTKDQIDFLELYKKQFDLMVNSDNAEQNQIVTNSKDIDECLEQIYKLVGLDPVKKEIQTLINLIRVNQLRLQRGIGSVSPFSHLVFTGNPGTGKTTVARLLGDIYAGLGLLESGHLVEIDRSGLVAGYIGQTAIKVSDVFKSALGGVLFIDEAYALCDNGNGGYGQEAIDTLMKLIEDHRGKILVIVAGYPENMEEFLNSNPGIKSRFNKTIYFPDYSLNELLEVLTKLAADSGFTFSEDAIQKSLSLLSDNADNNGYLPGNARFVRNLFHEIISNQANRIVNESNIDNDALQTIEESDICH